MQSKNFLLVIHFLIVLHKYKIINALCGEEVRLFEPHEHPATVCIINNAPYRSRTESVICSGILFSPDTVVTCEQCLGLFGHQGFVINAGTHDVEEGTNYSPVWFTSYDTWATHMVLRNNNLINDVAVIKVYGAIRDANIMPLAVAPRSPFHNFDGMVAEVTGCGTNMWDEVPQIKHVATALILTKDECEGRASLIRGSYRSISTNVLCTFTHPPAYLSPGDTGGGLINGNMLIALNVGITPWLNGTFHPDQLNVHIRLDIYRNFLLYAAHT